MVMRIGGLRRKTRGKFKKSIREKGKISITRFYQEFKEGDKVRLIAEPGYQKGMYHPNYHNKSGIILGKQGKCYKAVIKDQKKAKIIVVHPVHLRKEKK